MAFWKNFINLLEDFFGGIGKRLEAIEGNITNKLNTIEENTELIWKKIDPPPTVEANDEPIKTVADIPVELLPGNEARNNLIIQNIGICPCYIRLGEGVSQNDFHFVLAPDSRESHGNGGSIELKNWHGSVTAICEKETKVSVLEY
jgi:hypothetical protein